MRYLGFAAWTIVAAMMAAAPCRAGGFQALASDLARTARNAGIERVAVAPFVSADGTKSREGWNIAEKLTTQLVRTGRVQVVERERLPALMDEHRLAETGAIETSVGRRTGMLYAGGAVVTGSFVSRRKEYVINARVIDVRTGVVLGAAEQAAERDEEASLSMTGASDIWVPVPDFSVGPPELPQDDEESTSCVGAARRVDDLEAQVLELKARYWALRLRHGLSLTTLKTNPGSTISDSALKHRFYKRMQQWYEADSVPSLTEAEIRLFVKLDGEAYTLHRECGL